MSRLTIDDVIGHCNRHTERTEKHMSRETLENMPIEENSFIKEYWEHRQVAEWLEELQAYKDKEEQGLLLVLPVPLNSEVYVIDSGLIIPATADVMFLGVLWHEYKNEWFATRSEAEEALAKMGGK